MIPTTGWRNNSLGSFLPQANRKRIKNNIVMFLLILILLLIIVMYFFSITI